MTWDLLFSYLVLAAEPVPPAAPASGGLDLNGVVTLLVGAGGTGALAGLWGLVRMIQKGKLEDEETLIARLNADSKSQGDRADAAEQKLVEVRAEFDRVAGDLRRQRDEARDEAAYYRRILISHGFQLGQQQPHPGPAEPPDYDGDDGYADDWDRRYGGRHG